MEKITIVVILAMVCMMFDVGDAARGIALVAPIGCYRDKESRAISGGMTVITRNEDCFKRARKTNNQFFAVEYGNQCYTSEDAGNQYATYGKLNDDRCHYGRGGVWAMSVYKIALLTHIGCYRDKETHAISGGKTIVKGIMDCYNRAKDENNQFFAVEYGHECYTSKDAGNKYAIYGKVNEDRCRKGKGGFWAMDVYKIEN